MKDTRLISGLLGIPLVIIILVFANVYIVDIAFAIIAVMTLHEYFKALNQKVNPVVEVGYCSTVLIAIFHLIPQGYAWKILAIFVPLCTFFLFLIVIFTNMKINMIDIAVTLLGIAYIVLFLIFLPIIHGMENGKILVWFVLLIAWGTDTFAYMVGRKMGKHKFSDISPNKSIEGCIGGMVGAVLLAMLYAFGVNAYFSMEISYIYIGIMSVLLSIVSQIGDFAASSVKRYVGIKDFSHLIPGHGGMLDRIDSVIFVAPFAYLFLLMV